MSRRLNGAGGRASKASDHPRNPPPQIHAPRRRCGNLAGTLRSRRHFHPSAAEHSLKPKASQPLAGGRARNERLPPDHQTNTPHPIGMPANRRRPGWHPDGMRSPRASFSGGVAALNLRLGTLRVGCCVASPFFYTPRLVRGWRGEGSL